MVMVSTKRILYMFPSRSLVKMFPPLVSAVLLFEYIVGCCVVEETTVDINTVAVDEVADVVVSGNLGVVDTA